MKRGKEVISEYLGSYLWQKQNTETEKGLPKVVAIKHLSGDEVSLLAYEGSEWVHSPDFLEPDPGGFQSVLTVLPTEQMHLSERRGKNQECRLSF